MIGLPSRVNEHCCNDVYESDVPGDNEEKRHGSASAAPAQVDLVREGDDIVIDQ